MAQGPRSAASLFQARAVAIVGASDESYYARSVFENLRRAGFPDDRIVAVNPNRASAFGRACVASISAVGTPVDLAVVVTPARTVPAIVRECAERRVRSCLVFSDGFAELGEEGLRLQRDVAAAAGDVVLCGPNTMGLVAPASGLAAWGAELPADLRAGTISLAFQSSGLLNLLFTLLAERRLGVRTAISVGNEAGVTIADALAHIVDDEGARVAVLFVEAVRDVATFRAALERAESRRLPIVALRVGRSERARRSIAAHTGNLASSGASYDALLRQHGVAVVGNIDELMETTMTFARASAPAGDGVGIVTISGGDCSYLADLAERTGVRLPEPASRAEIAAALRRPALAGNPLDAGNTLRTDPRAFGRAVDLLASDPDIAIVAPRLNLGRPSEVLRDGYRRTAEAIAARGKVPAFLTRAAEPLDPAWHDLFADLGVPFLQEYERALRALAALISFHRHARRQRAGGPGGPAREILAAAVSDAPLPWRTTAALLDAYGIPLAPWELVRDRGIAHAAAERMGYPVAVKAAIPHKTDLGALRLGLATPDAVATAYDDVAARAPGADIIVQRMETGVVECLAGVARDAALGPVLVAGIGGIFAEALHDVALRVPPIDRRDVTGMLEELRGSALFTGVRGRPPADREAFADVLLRLAGLALDAGDLLDQLDLNPIVVRADGSGVVAVDALVVRGAAAPPSERPA